MNIGTSLSGLFAAKTQFDVAANDIANANTAGYRQARTELAEGNPGVQVTGISKPGDAAGTPADPDAPSDVSLAEEMTDMIVARHTYGANAQMLRSTIELQGALFDRRV